LEELKELMELKSLLDFLRRFLRGGSGILLLSKAFVVEDRGGVIKSDIGVIFKGVKKIFLRECGVFLVVREIDLDLIIL
jgi:hypothetical protein